MSEQNLTGGAPAEQAKDELTLDKETVRDLEPTGNQQDAVKGGGSSVWGTCAHCCQSAVSAKLK